MTATDFNNAIAYQSDFLRPYAYSFTNDNEAAKDLFQDTITKALLNRDKYRIGTNMKAWLYTIMRNTFINSYRKERRFTRVGTDLSEDVMMQHVNRSNTNAGWSKVRANEIRKKIEKLPESLRICFELYNMGYKYQEIADYLDEPLGTVKSRIHFARKTLSKQTER